MIYSSLTCGSTWHSAGLIGHLRMEPLIYELATRSTHLYETLAEETGLSTGTFRTLYDYMVISDLYLSAIP